MSIVTARIDLSNGSPRPVRTICTRMQNAISLLASLRGERPADAIAPPQWNIGRQHGADGDARGLRQRIRLNQRRDRSPDTSASTAAAAAKSAETSVSRCSKKSFVLRFL